MVRRKGFTPILVLLVVVVFAIAVGGAYYLGKGSTNTPLYTSTPIAPQPTNTTVGQDNSPVVAEFFDLPSDWIAGKNEARTKQNCYSVSAQNIGKLPVTFREYFKKEYNGEDLDALMSNTKQFVWQGIESYTLPPLGIGEINTVYIRPGDEFWFKIAVWYAGPGEGTTPSQSYNCDNEEKELETVVRNIRFL